MPAVDVVFVVGHSGISVGAVGQGVPEAYFWSLWGPSIVRRCRTAGLRSRLQQRRVEDGDWKARQLHLVNRVVALDATLIVDLHFNGGGYPGSVAIYRPEALEVGTAWPSRRAAEELSKAITAAQSTAARSCYDSAGADGLPRSWTGRETVSADGRWYPAGSELYLLSRTGPAAAVVLEPFDGSVGQDYAAGLAALQAGRTQAAIAQTCVELLMDWGRVA